jgi:hypothetical protein
MDSAGSRFAGQGFPLDEDEDARMSKRVAAFGFASLGRPASFEAANRLRLSISIIDGTATATRSDK